MSGSICPLSGTPPRCSIWLSSITVNGYGVKNSEIPQCFFDEVVTRFSASGGFVSIAEYTPAPEQRAGDIGVTRNNFKFVVEEGLFTNEHGERFRYRAYMTKKPNVYGYGEVDWLAISDLCERIWKVTEQASKTKGSQAA